MTQGCPADDCLSLHPTEQSLAMHLYKTDDEAHAEWDDYNETLKEVFREDYVFQGAEPDVEDGPDTVDDGPSPNGSDTVDEPGDDGPDPDDVDDTPSTAATDGGPRSPPEPELPDEPEDDEPPDHLVPVEEFVDDVEDELPDDITDSDEWDEFADELRDDPEGFVDVRASDIEAGEVRTTDA